MWEVIRNSQASKKEILEDEEEESGQTKLSDL